MKAIELQADWNPTEQYTPAAGDVKGKKTYRGIEYGIESYFIPEENRSVIEKDLRKNRRQAKAQIKVDKYGNAALVRLMIDDRVYEY